MTVLENGGLIGRDLVNMVVGSGNMKILLYRCIIAALAASGWLLAGAVHEIGHAIAAKAAGMEILHMQPWALFGRVHVQFRGETTPSWMAAIHISGMLCAVLVGIGGTIAASLFGRRWRRATVAVWFFVPMMCQSLAWLGLPLAVQFGANAPTDDVTKFIQQTGWPAPAVSLIGLALVLSCAAIVVSTFNQGRANQALHGTADSRADASVSVP